MKCLNYFGMSSMKEGTSAQLSGRGELHGGARVTTLVTLRKCTLGNKREIKTLKFVLASTKGFKGGLAWIKPSKKDMAVTFSYSQSRLREYVDSKRRLVAKKLCCARPTRRSWPLKQGSTGYISELKEDLEQKITTWQREVDLKLMKSVWGAHVRTPEEHELSEECVCEPPLVCLCCPRPPETAKQYLLYAYQGLKDTTKDAEPVEDHLPASIHQGASNLHSDEDTEDNIKLLDPRIQKLIRTYLEVFGELPPPASRDKLVQMDLKLKPEFVGHKIRRRPYPALKEQPDEIERQIQECIDTGLVVEYKDGDYPQHCTPYFLVAKPR